MKLSIWCVYIFGGEDLVRFYFEISVQQDTSVYPMLAGNSDVPVPYFIWWPNLAVANISGSETRPLVNQIYECFQK